MRISRAIVAGERGPNVLASYCDMRRHSSIEVIKAALVGNDRDEHIFTPTPSLDLYDFYQAKIEECDHKLEAAVAALTIKAIGDVPTLPMPGPTAAKSVLRLLTSGLRCMAFWART